jgi:hypothetical protein
MALINMMHAGWPAERSAPSRFLFHPIGTTQINGYSGVTSTHAFHYTQKNCQNLARRGGRTKQVSGSSGFLCRPPSALLACNISAT